MNSPKSNKPAAVAGINRETANQEFERFADLCSIDLDLEGLDENDRKDSERDRYVLTRAIMKQHVVISDEGLVVMTPQHSDNTDKITFYRPHGSSLMATDKKKRTADVGKMFTSMGEMTRTSASRFSQMDHADLRVAMAVWTLFLA